MKIKKDGTKWWLQAPITCPVCYCEFKLEESDKVTGGMTKKGGRVGILTSCPCCNFAIAQPK